MERRNEGHIYALLMKSGEIGESKGKIEQGVR